MLIQADSLLTGKRFFSIKVLSILFFSLVVSFCHTGCGKRPPLQKKQLVFWTLQLSPVFDDYIKSVIAGYEELHPDSKVIWEDVPYDAVVQKLLAAGAAGTAPDVVNLSADFLSKFAGYSLLRGFDSAGPGISFDSLYQPYALEDCTFDGVLYALPWYLNTYTVIYNKRLCQAAGFSSGDMPRTYSQIVHFIREYKQRTGKYAVFWNIGKDSYLPMMLGSEGIELVDSAFVRPMLLQKKLIRMVEEWVTLYREGYLPTESAISSGASLIEPYQSGNVALVMTGPVFLKRVKDNSPRIYSETGISPPLVGETGRHDLATMAIAVLNTSQHAKDAQSFALYLTNSENQVRFCKLATIFPSTKASLRDSFFTVTGGDLETRARVQGAELLPSARRLSRYLRHPRFDELRESFEEAIQSACLEGTPVQEALSSAQNKWENILKKK